MPARPIPSGACADPRRRRALRGTGAAGIGLLGAAAGLAPAVLRAQDVQSRTIKLAFVNTAESAHGVGARRLAELVDERSRGRLKIRLHPGGTLGGEVAVASSMQGGIVEMSMMGPGILTGQDREFGVFDTPFLFSTYDEVYATLDGPAGRRILDRLPPKGLVGLSYWDHGFRILTNSRRPVERLDDLQGMKIRVQQIPVFIDAFNALGTNAVPLPFTELYTALETRAVDGQENPFVSIEVTKFYEVQKYATDTRHAYSPLLVLAGRKFWDRLSDDERRLLASSAEDVRDHQRRASREMDERAVSVIGQKGMTVTRLTEAERTRMKQRLQPVIERHLAGTGQAGQDLVAAIAALRGGR